VLNVQQQSDKLRAELKEGHEHYIEILAKYCAANERAEKLQAQLPQMRDLTQRAFDVTTKVNKEGGLIYWATWQQEAEKVLDSISPNAEWLKQQRAKWIGDLLHVITHALDFEPSGPNVPEQIVQHILDLRKQFNRSTEESEQHDRKVKQEALREAADSKDGPFFGSDGTWRRFLRASADALDPQAGGPKPPEG
jgi:uncharacterized coiled-coil DUF342 family protein